MTKRREILSRISSLGEIEEILRAMKSLALVETRRISTFIEAQRSAVQVIETALADFTAFYRPDVSSVVPQRDVLCVIGAERGFCGDFNARLVSAIEATVNGSSLPLEMIMIGNRLAQTWGERTPAPRVIEGASVADEVPTVLNRLLDDFRSLLDDGDKTQSVGFTVLLYRERSIESRRLLPVPELPQPPRLQAYPPYLTLPPQQLLLALADQYLYALLHGMYYDSLLLENQKRLEHMDRAINKVEEKLEVLTRRQNQMRQEEITEDIEVILLAIE
ncbi:MAG TPA: FoF1 ATP synthase subunit gamma [Burkholderiales bacterium]|nr:FoF1 ATP synthase subunit gamma [Burkholderiales bacterium]